MKNRIEYVELLRIVAAYLIVLLHVAAGNWGNVVLGTYEWKVLNFYDSLARFGVPVFVMISGMFLLDPDKIVSLKDIYGKYILRIVKAFVVWSLLYALFTNITNYDVFNWDVFIKSFMFGHYHMWYLYMIIGLYIITPFLRKIVSDRKLVEYFLWLSFIFTFFTPLIIKLFNLIDLETIIKKIDFHFALGYVGYYIAGYYLKTYDIDKNRRNVIYVLGVIGIVCTYLFTDIISLKSGKANNMFYSYFAPNVMVVSVAVFVFFKYEVSKLKFGERSLKLINILSICSFRIYLVHDFFIMFLSKSGISTLNYNPLISVPIIATLVYTGSFIISYLIEKTPLKMIL